MADFVDMLLAAPVSPLPITITATTTLEDVINATILKPGSSTHTNSDSVTQSLSFRDDSPTQGSSPSLTQTHSPDYDPSPAESRLDDALFSLLDSPRKQTKLTKNPMFRDLQAILKSDCNTSAIPDSLFQTLPRGKTTNSVVTRELRLQQRLSKLRDYYPTQITQLSSFHKYQASIVETDRYRELHELTNPRPIMRAAINDFYDQMLHQIIDRVEISVGTMEEALSHQLSTTQTQNSTTRPPTQYPAPTQTQYSAPTQTQYQVPSQYQYSAPTLTHYSAPTHTQYSAPTQYQAPTYSATTQNSATTQTQYPAIAYSATTQYSASTQNPPVNYSAPTNPEAPTQTEPKDAPFKLNLRTRPSLSQRAIRLMEVWYNANIDHPYPDTPDVETLATAGNITEEQVRKWFANKRNRSRNIRPMSQIVRRKRQIQAAANRVIRVPSLC